MKVHNKTDKETENLSRQTEVKVAKQRLPDVIVAGIKKCGTGAVIEMLKFHKNIAAPDYGKTENNLFDDNKWARGVPYFISKMAKAFPDQLVVTKSQTLIEFPNQDIIHTKLQESQGNCYYAGEII